MPEITPSKAAKKCLKSAWKPVQSGNPKGRWKGSRKKLSEQFLASLCDDFEVHGEAVLETVRINNPSTYLRVTASRLPKQAEIGIANNLQHLPVRRTTCEQN